MEYLILANIPIILESLKANRFMNFPTQMLTDINTQLNLNMVGQRGSPSI